MVKQTAVNSRRHRDQIAFAQYRFGIVVAILNHQGDLPFEHEEHLFYVIMQMQRAFTFGRQHHGGKGEVLRRNGVGIAGDAGGAGADVAHLRAAIFRVEIGLEFQRIPVVFTAFEARDTRLHPLFHRQMVRFQTLFCSYG